MIVYFFYGTFKSNAVLGPWELEGVETRASASTKDVAQDLPHRQGMLSAIRCKFSLGYSLAFRV